MLRTFIICILFPISFVFAEQYIDNLSEIEEILGKDEVDLKTAHDKVSGFKVEEKNYDIDPPIIRDAKRSVIDWKNIEYGQFLNIKEWQKNRIERDRFPDWKEIYINSTKKEIIGHVLSCYKECRFYRGDKYIIGRHLSQIIEGDELQTKSNSYALLILNDGTLIRVSPNTSIVFNEYNLSQKNHFNYFQLNSGHVFVMPREIGKFNFLEKFETDPIFLPLMLTKSNLSNTQNEIYLKNRNSKEKYTELAELEDFLGYKEHLEKINKKLVHKKEIIMKRDSTFFIVLPNITLESKNSSFHVFYHPGGKSTIKINESIDGFESVDLREKKNQVYFRGYENFDTKELDFGQSYDVDPKGKTLTQLNENPFLFIDLLTRRSYSAFLARELMLEKRYAFNFDKEFKSREIATEYGIRIWDHAFSNEMKYRHEFLMEYTRRVQTTYLKQAQKIKPLETYEKEFNISFFSQSMLLYYQYLKSQYSMSNQLMKNANKLDYYIWTLNKISNRQP